jgi:DNA-binding response OmpR family regulator
MVETVLIVEDDRTTSDLIDMYLKRDGYKVIVAYDGIDGLRMARDANPNLIVLDLSLPGMDGREVCRTIRGESDIPIVMVTARVEEEDRLIGLDLGADDYVTKPFSPRELTARIRAILRRSNRNNSEGRETDELKWNDIWVDQGKHSVTVNGNAIELTPTEFSILVLLMQRPGRVFTRGQVIDQVFGYDFEGFDRSVDAHMSNLRRKVEDGVPSGTYIKTIYGVGYKLAD